MTGHNIWQAVAAAVAVTASASAAGPAAPLAKIDNVLRADRPLAASEAQFIEAALMQPAKGSCEALSPDPGFFEEMLVRFGANGAKAYERRVALVVGNGAYQSISALKNPPNDAASMAKMFRALGFTVYRAVDATEKSLNDCFARFKGDLEAGDAQGAKADIALFFYAGHGVQLTSQADNEKRNYMLSVDAKVDTNGKATGFRQVDQVLNEMRAHAKQAVFLYDACRNAPYGEGVVKEADGAAVRQFDAEGAAPVSAEETDAASQAGLFIAYATSPGKTADDAWGEQGSTHSPFTEALLTNLPRPGALFEEALLKAYYSVGELTGWKQTPWTSSSLTAELKLNGEVRTADIVIKSAELAARAATNRGLGLKGEALAAALKGQPREWSDGAGAMPFGAARAELFRAFDSPEVSLMGHDDQVVSVEFSPDGRRIVTAAFDGTARLWDARTGAALERFDSESPLLHAAFSRDGSRIVTATGRDATIWDALSGALLKSFPGGETAVFSPDGKRIATGSRERTFRIYDADSGALLKALDNAGAITSIAYAPDGQRLVTASRDNKAVKIRDAKTGAVLLELQGHVHSVASAEFSADGRRVFTASDDGSAKLWNATTGEPIKTLKFDSAFFRGADLSADGSRIVSGAIDGKVKIWDAPSGALVKIVETESYPTNAAAFSPDGRRIVTGGEDGAAKVWDALSAPLLTTLRGHEHPIRSAAFARDGRRVVTASDYSPARIWDADSGAELVRLEGVDVRRDYATSAAFSPAGDRVVTVHAEKKIAIVWDAARGSILRRLEGHPSHSATYAPDGRRIVTASSDMSARVWDAQTGVVLLTFSGHKGVVTSAAFSPDGELIVTGSSDRTAKIWDAATGEKLMTFEHPRAVDGVAFSFDGLRIATACADKAVRIWNARTGKELAAFAGHRDDVKSVAFSPDDRRIVTGSSDATAKLWDSATGALLATLEGHTPAYGWVHGVAFSADGRRVITASNDATAKIWDPGLFGREMLDAAYALLTDDLRAEVERKRIRYWEVDPQLLQ